MKKIKMILIVLLIIFDATAVHSAEYNLIIHYKKDDGYYNNLLLIIESENHVKKERFNYYDEYGMTLKTNIIFEEEKLVVKIHDEINNKDVDEFIIDLRKGNEVWHEKDEGVKYISPKLYVSTYEEIKELEVEIKYINYEKNYEGLYLEIKNDNGSKNKKYYIENKGSYGTFKLKVKNNKPIYFQIKKGLEIIDFEDGVIYPNQNKDGVLKAYMIEGNKFVGYDEEKFNNYKYIKSSEIISLNKIKIELSYPIKIGNNNKFKIIKEESDTNKENDDIKDQIKNIIEEKEILKDKVKDIDKSKEHDDVIEKEILEQGIEKKEEELESLKNKEKREIEIKSITNVNIIGNDYCESFEINVEKLNIDDSYKVVLEGYGSSQISKEKAYDSVEYNKKMEKIEEMGITKKDTKFKFKLFMPLETEVILNIYNENLSLYKAISMEKKNDGFFEIEIEENDILNKYYAYRLINVEGRSKVINDPFLKIISEDGLGKIVANDSIGNYRVKKNIEMIYSEKATKVFEVEEKVVNTISNLNAEINKLQENAEVIDSYINKDVIEKKTLDKELDKYLGEKEEKDTILKDVDIIYYEYMLDGLVDIENSEGTNEKKGENENRNIENEKEFFFPSEQKKPVGEKKLRTEKSFLSDRSIDEKIKKSNLSYESEKLNYTHFYIKNDSYLNLFRNEENIKYLKEFIKDLQEKGKGVIIDYRVNENRLQGINDKYYFKNKELAIERGLVKKLIKDDIESLINIYEIEGVVLNEEYYTEEFIEEVKDEFSNIHILSKYDMSDKIIKNMILGEEVKDEILKLKNESINFSEISTDVDSTIDEYITNVLLVLKGIPYLSEVDEKNIEEVNKLIKIRKEYDHFQSEIEIIKDGGGVLIYDQLDRRTNNNVRTFINYSDNDLMVYVGNMNGDKSKYKIISNNKVDKGEYLNDKILLSSRSVWMLEMEKGNDIQSEYVDYSEYIIIVGNLLLSVGVIWIVNKTYKKII